MYEPGPLWPKTQSDHCRLYVHTLSGPQELGQIPPRLRAHECRVFIVPLAAMAASLLELRAVLSSEERRRADGFHFARDAAMFAVIHGVLRHLLARLLATAPEAVGFTVQPGGKPALAPGFSDSLRFNISHSRSYAAVALARNFELGVDIEDVRPMDDMQELARDCLHPWEARCIEAAVGPDAALRQFYAIWTQKEAVLKALGEGLRIPLHSFRVPGEAEGWAKVPDSVHLNGPLYVSTLQNRDWMGAVALARPV